jgi:serine/threonine-protein kinase RsbT
MTKSPVEEQILNILRGKVSPILAKSILALSLNWAKVDLGALKPGDDKRLLKELTKGLRLYVKDPGARQECVDQLSALTLSSAQTAPAKARRLLIGITEESHIVSARGAGRDLCQEGGFSGAVQIKVATAISELAPNIVQYAGEGEITISSIDTPRRGIEIIAVDSGPGIANLELVLSGDFKSKKGMGIGLKGTKKLMDEFDITTSAEEGTRVKIRKYL